MTFIVLGFVVMILVQLIEASQGGHSHDGGDHSDDDHGEDDVCTLLPAAFANIKTPVNITCTEGNMIIMTREGEA